MSDFPKVPDIHWHEGFDEAKKEELFDMLLAFDAAAGDWERGHTVKFPSEQDRLRLLHAAQDKWLKTWSKPGPCMHPGCTSQSISRSHTVPMSGSLKEIAESGHVVAPRFSKEGLRIVRVGIREASTFPGFCDAHEAQFASFKSQRK